MPFVVIQEAVVSFWMIFWLILPEYNWPCFRKFKELHKAVATQLKTFVWFQVGLKVGPGCHFLVKRLKQGDVVVGRIVFPEVSFRCPQELE